jgi:hypothetical protein
MPRDSGLKLKPGVFVQKKPKESEEDDLGDLFDTVPTDPTDFLKKAGAKKLAEQVQKEKNKGNNGSSNSHFELMRACLERI